MEMQFPRAAEVTQRVPEEEVRQTVQSVQEPSAQTKLRVKVIKTVTAFYPSDPGHLFSGNIILYTREI